MLATTIAAGACLSARADDAEATAHAEKWAAALRKPDALDRFLASWNLAGLAPRSAAVVIPLVAQKKLAPDALTAALQTLGEIGEKDANAPLAAIVQDARQLPQARIAALVATAKIGGKEATQTLTQVAGAEVAADSPLLRCAALVALGMRGDPLPAALLEKALKADPEVRRAALRAIGLTGDKTLAPPCAKALSDDNVLVVAEAARSLAKIGDPKAAEKIEALMKKVRNPALRFFFVEALARVGKKAATDELLACAEDPESQAQSSSVGILVDLGERRALATFRGVVQASVERTGKVEPGADVRAAAGLGALGDKDAGAVLVAALERGTAPELRREAASSLGILKVKDGVPALKTAARSNDRILRAIALVSLGQAGEKTDADDVAAALEDKDPAIRYAACAGLGLLGNKKAVPALRGLFADEHDFVAAAAREAVARLEEKPVTVTDTRDPAILVRLRALEREYVLRAQVGNLFQSYATYLAQNPDVYAKVVVGWETIVDSCGGAHSNLKVPVTEWKKVADRSGDRARAAQVTELDREHMEEAYRLAKFRSDTDGALARPLPQTSNSAGSGK